MFLFNATASTESYTYGRTLALHVALPLAPTRLLIGQILVVFAIMVAGVWTATQWCAAMLGYQAQLGAPWFIAGGMPVYRPWAIFLWWYHYDAYAPQVFDKAGTLAGASRSEAHTSELQSLMRISSAVFC